MPDDLTRIERLADRYTQSPWLRSLAQLMRGFGSPVDTFLTAAMDRIREERAREFLDEVARGNVTLTDEEIASEPRFHAAMVALRYALNTARREKIRYFARFLVGYYRGGVYEHLDAFEEACRILDDLSFREVQVLAILRRLESIAPLDGQEQWNRFLVTAKQELGIEPTRMPAILARLARTGLFEMTDTALRSGQPTGGTLTPYFATWASILPLDDVESPPSHPDRPTQQDI